MLSPAGVCWACSRSASSPAAILHRFFFSPEAEQTEEELQEEIHKVQCILRARGYRVRFIGPNLLPLSL